MSWGRPRSCHCGECHKCKRADYMREWYRKKTFEERRQMREGRDKELARQRDLERHYRMSGQIEYETRRAAVFAVNGAIKRGDMERQPCEVCGVSPAQAHHDDYSKPLDVRWLCTLHHAEHHAGMAA